MSLGYSVTVKLKVPYHIETIRFILEKGSSLGFIYRRFILGSTDTGTPQLDINQAIKSILTGTDEDLRCLLVQNNDGWFLLHAIKDNDLVSLMISRLSYNWMKKYYKNYQDLDVNRYAKLMLNLVSDFKIIEFEIYNGKY